VALISTAIVAAVYLVIAVVVVVIVTARQTGDVDSQVLHTLDSATSELGNPAPGVSPLFASLGGNPAQYVWCIDDGGQSYEWVVADRQFAVGSSALALPASDAGVSATETVSLDGGSYRLAGADVPQALTVRSTVFNPETGAESVLHFDLARVVVGESLASVSNAQANLILAESIVGPLLLIAVFLGALTVGRRVAAPIELARVRQMEFTADASHELRTPLSVIEAQTSLALSEPRDPAWYRAAFQRVQGESGRMRRLVEDLLWLARFDSTRDRAQAEHVDLAVLAQVAADRFTAVAEARGIRLSVRTAPDPLVIQAPPEWLDRLLGVLLDNACKYAPEGGSVDVAVWADGSRIRLAVDDSGPGIPPAERPRIFDRFRRATDQPGGAGLGLAIADSVVAATGGQWHIADSPGGGASMGVSWPRSLSGASRPVERAPQPASPPPPPPPRVGPAQPPAGSDPQPAS
jgi:signal transduction histidine kinase